MSGGQRLSTLGDAALDLRRFLPCALLVCGGVWLCGPIAPVFAQSDEASEVADEQAAAAGDSGEADEAPLDGAEPAYSEDELDALVAPIALYPDSLLAQVFVAATYPLDVIKADRIVDDAIDDELSDDELSSALDAEGFDPSVSVLAYGFPDVIGRMADELAWTEELGDAVIAQTDDVFDAVQRQRARAQAVGNLASNEAQEVVVEDDAISIAPADPEVVYVPTYDPEVVYQPVAYSEPVPTTTTTTTAAEPVTTTVVEEDSGYSTGALITTGLVAFGAGILVNEVFDGDDDDWDDYWYRRPVDWDNDRFYPRPEIDVDRDVDINIDNSRDIDIDRGDRELNVDRDGAWQPTARQKDDARDAIQTRKGGDSRDGTLAAAGGAAVERSQADRERDDLKAKMQARSPDAGGDATGRLAARQGAAGDDRAAKLQQAAGEHQARNKDAALAKKSDGLTRAKDAGDRGKASAAKAKAGEVKRARSDGDKKKISKPKSNKKLAEHKPKKSSALKKERGGGKAKKASARGKKSVGDKKRTRRG